MKRLLLLAATVAGLAFPVTAGAAVPCRDRIYNDWYHDGRVASSYPTSCYRDALKHIPIDAKVYTSLSTDIRSAMLASLRLKQGKPAPKEVGRGLTAIGHGTVGGQLASSGHPAAKPPTQPLGSLPGGPAPSLPGGATTSAPVGDMSSSTPLPILVLGGLALVLAAAGAIGTGVRFARRRR
jgi:hypothetical protein